MSKRCECCGGVVRVDPVRLANAIAAEGFEDICITVAGLVRHAAKIDGPLRAAIDGFDSRDVGWALAKLADDPGAIEGYEMRRDGIEHKVQVWRLEPVVGVD